MASPGILFRLRHSQRVMRFLRAILGVIASGENRGLKRTPHYQGIGFRRILTGGRQVCRPFPMCRQTRHLSAKRQERRSGIRKAPVSASLLCAVGHFTSWTPPRSRGGSLRRRPSSRRSSFPGPLRLSFLRNLGALLVARCPSMPPRPRTASNPCFLSSSGPRRDRLALRSHLSIAPLLDRDFFQVLATHWCV